MKITDNHNLQCGTVESFFEACQPWVGGVVKSSSLLTAPLRGNSFTDRFSLPKTVSKKCRVC